MDTFEQANFWNAKANFLRVMGQAHDELEVLATAIDLDPNFLENYLIRLAKQVKSVPLDVENKKNETEADRTDMQVFLQHMLGMLPVLGVHAFEQPTPGPRRQCARADLQGQKSGGPGLRVHAGICGQGGFAGGRAGGAVHGPKLGGQAPRVD